MLFDVAITFASPGSGLPLLCHRRVTVRLLELCELQWTAAEAAVARDAHDGEGQGQAVASVSASAAELRLRLRVPAVLGLTGSSCSVRCCGERVCSVRVVGAAQSGAAGAGGEDAVEVEVRGSAMVAHGLLTLWLRRARDKY